VATGSDVILGPRGLVGANGPALAKDGHAVDQIISPCWRFFVKRNFMK